MSEIKVAGCTEVNWRMKVVAIEEKLSYRAIKSLCEVYTVPVHILGRVATLGDTTIPTHYYSVKVVLPTDSATCFKDRAWVKT